MSNKLPRRMSVLQGGAPDKPKKTPDDIELAKCRRCERQTGVHSLTWLEVRMGGYWDSRGRLREADKYLICAGCFARDGHVEVIAEL